MRRCSWCDRWFYGVAGLLLAAVAVAQWTSIRLETQTWDEAFELASGYQFLKTGQTSIEPEHPPLAKVVAALPLLALDPVLPNDTGAGDVEFGNAFLYRGRHHADTLLFAGRMPSLAITLLLGVALALWMRRHFGSAAALLALALYCADPNIVAYGRYLKNDILLTFLAFLFCVAWSAYLEAGGMLRLATSGILLGLSMAAKFSAAFLIPVAVFLAAAREWQSDRPRAWRRMILRVMALGALALVALLAVYGRENRKLIPMNRSARVAAGLTPMRDAVNTGSPVGRALAWAGTHMGWRDHALATSLSIFAAHGNRGHVGYLFGHQSENGWWYYFPAAFAVKTPVGTLAALLVAAVLGVAGLLRRGPQLRRARFAMWPAVVAIIVYAPLCCASRVNIGIRHLLPIYPFIFGLISVSLVEWRWRYAGHLAALLALLSAIETASVHPHYTAFFNRIAGGPANGPRYLVDSNIDWGQDVRKLSAYMAARGEKRVCINYFGTADLDYYGVGFTPLFAWLEDPSETPRCLVAVSVTPLMGAYVPPEQFAWLRARTPEARIGYSIYVYDVKRSEIPEPSARGGTL